MREIYEIELPISEATADVIGMPTEYFARAVRRCGRLAVIKDEAVDRRLMEKTIGHEPAGDKFFSSATNEAKIFITLGAGNEFGISDSSMFIRSTRRDSKGNIRILDLGPATKENLERLIMHMHELKMHMP